MGQSNEAYLNKWIQFPVFKSAHLGLSFQDVQSGKTVLQYQQDKLLNPASTIKVLTSLVYYDLEKEPFDTQLFVRGKLQKNGVLKGDLVLRGNGDPVLGSPRIYGKNAFEALLDQLVTAVKKTGISCIDGELIVDVSNWGTDAVPDTWYFYDLGNYYAAGVWSLNILENQYKLGLKGSKRVGSPVLIDYLEPKIPFLTVQSELITGPSNSGDQAYIYAAPFQNRAFVRGTIPAGHNQYTIKGSIPNPPQMLAIALKDALEQAWISCPNYQVTYETQKAKHSIWKHQSISNKTLITLAIQKSINLYCEAFLKRLGAGNRIQGLNRIKKYIQSRDLFLHPYTLADGSGLSQRNLITAQDLTNFVHYHYNQKGSALKQIFAQSGVSGTLTNRFKRNLKGKVWGKSGSMEGVRAYTGILVCKSGKEVAFTIMVNHYTSKNKEINLAIEKLLEHVYNQYE